MSPLSQLQMTLPGGFAEGIRADGSADERWELTRLEVLRDLRGGLGPTLAFDFGDCLAVGGGLASNMLPDLDAVTPGVCQRSSNQFVETLPLSVRPGASRHGNLPDWAVSIIAVAVGLGPGLALLNGWPDRPPAPA
jgi:hypothetical protein